MEHEQKKRLIKRYNQEREIGNSHKNAIRALYVLAQKLHYSAARVLFAEIEIASDILAHCGPERKRA